MPSQQKAVVAADQKRSSTRGVHFHAVGTGDPLPRLLQIFAQLGFGVAAVAPDGAIEFSNETFWAVLGLDKRPPAPGPLLEAVLAEAAGAARDSAPLAAGRSELILRDARIVTLEVAPLPEAGWMVSVLEVTAEMAARRQAEQDARQDSLTGLGNRIVLGERAAEALATISRTGGTAALICLDLDRFKAINDSLGHPIGDELLRKVAGRIRSAMRPTDVVARIGGDEFTALISDTTPEAAAATAKRLVDLVGRSYVVEGHLVNVGASVGVALAPDDGRSFSELHKNADLALYRAKEEGRGTFRFFTPEMDARMQARRALEIDLRRALALKEFELFYQPQYNLGQDRITGCEALLRWRNPERGLVSPAEFIPLAEEIGLIVPLGEWVIRTACRDAAQWPVETSVAVNVSAVQLASPKLIPTVVSALASSHLGPSRLEIEITESVLLSNDGHTSETLHRLRDMGIRISMDDFGTGYSSLSSLHSFPFDKIKIDQSFVRGPDAADKGAAIVRTIAALGSTLGMSTTAEGVETREQLERIRENGCTDIQGYHISRPLPLEEVRKLLHGTVTES